MRSLGPLPDLWGGPTRWRRRCRGESSFWNPATDPFGLPTAAPEVRQVLCLAAGVVEVEQTHYRCRDCGSGFFPSDRTFELQGQTAKQSAAGIVADTLVPDSFGEASRKLCNLTEVIVSATTLRRWTRNFGEEMQLFEREVVEEGMPGADRIDIGGDGTGVPLRRTGTKGVRGRQGDGAARTREAKAIATFAAEGTRPKTGEPTKDEGSDVRNALIDNAAAVDGLCRATEIADRLQPLRCLAGLVPGRRRPGTTRLPSAGCTMTAALVVPFGRSPRPRPMAACRSAGRNPHCSGSPS